LNVDSVTAAAAKALLPMPALSTAGSSSTFGISAGNAVDSTGLFPMALGSAYTKTTSAWAVGSASGALDTGTIANSTWYHVYLIRRPDTGVVDVIFSTNATSPTLPTNYTQYRRLGSMLTDGSAHWVQFVQVGDKFMWTAPVGDVAFSNLGLTPMNFALTVPTGFNVGAIINVYIFNLSASTSANIYSPLQGTQLTTSPLGNANLTTNTAPGASSSRMEVLTDTAAHIAAVASQASTQLYVVTQGWIDTRGRI
jgi:hypothetical protein